MLLPCYVPKQVYVPQLPRSKASLKIMPRRPIIRMIVATPHPDFPWEERERRAFITHVNIDRKEMLGAHVRSLLALHLTKG